MSRFQIQILAVVYFAAFVVRWISLAHVPFFCDVPENNRAVATGSMLVQFPGYVCFHLLAKAISLFYGNSFKGLLFVTMTCGMGALIYCMLFAAERAGFPGALLAGVALGFSPMAVYFSCVGASYATDMMAMSAMIYHGNRTLTGEKRHYYYVLGWYVFGFLMRMSCPFSGIGLLYLLWKDFRIKKAAVTFVVLGFTATFVFLITVFFYGGYERMIMADSIPATLSSHHSLFWFALNTARIILYFSWALSLYLVLMAFVLWILRKEIDTRLLWFFLCLGIPYFCVILRFIPEAGYICLLVPLLVSAPWLIRTKFWTNVRASTFAAILAAVLLLQFFGARLLSSKNVVSMAMNAYVLSYSYHEIQDSFSANLRDLATPQHLDEPYKALDPEQTRQY